MVENNMFREDIFIIMSLVREWGDLDDQVLTYTGRHHLDSIKYLKFGRRMTFNQAYNHLWS